MSIGLIGRKRGMTQVFQPDGTMVAVSVLAVAPNTVTRVRTTDRDGYTAVQLGTDEKQRLSKPRAGQLGDLPSLGTLREFRVDDVSGYEVGQTLAIGDVFADGDLVDVIHQRLHVAGTAGHGMRPCVDRHQRRATSRRLLERETGRRRAIGRPVHAEQHRPRGALGPAYDQHRAARVRCHLCGDRAHQ